jgi:hypothetical protein
MAIIKKGDSLSSIAAANNLTVDQLFALNKNNPAVKNKNLIVQGGNITLPTGTQTKPSPSVVASTTAATVGATTTPSATNIQIPSIKPPGIVKQPVTPAAPAVAGATGAPAATATPAAPAAAPVPTPAVPSPGTPPVSAPLDAATIQVLKSSGATFNQDGTYSLGGKHFDASGNPIVTPPISAAAKTALTAAGATFNPDGSYTIGGKTYDASGNPVTTAVTPSSVPSTDWAGSFATYGAEMADIGNQLSALDTSIASSLGSTPLEGPLHEQRLQDIRAGAERSRSDVQAAAETATLGQQKAGELLGLGPAAVKYKVDQFTAESNQLFKSITTSLAQIEQDKNNAILNEDYNYANQLNQEKLNLLQAQRTAITDRQSFMTNAFNIMLGAKQEARLTSNDAITRVQNMYSLQQKPTQDDWTAAGFAGAPPSVLNLRVWSAPVLQDGKLMQTNTQTGEVRAISYSYFGTLDPVQQQERVQSDIQAFKDSTLTSVSQIQDPEERAAYVKAQNVANAASSTAPTAGEKPGALEGMFDWIVNRLTQPKNLEQTAGSFAEPATSTPTGPATGPAATVDIGSNAALGALGAAGANQPIPTQ